MKNRKAFPFIFTFRQNNPSIYDTIKSSVDMVKRSNVPRFNNIKII